MKPSLASGPFSDAALLEAEMVPGVAKRGNSNLKLRSHSFFAFFVALDRKLAGDCGLCPDEDLRCD